MKRIFYLVGLSLLALIISSGCAQKKVKTKPAPEKQTQKPQKEKQKQEKKVQKEPEQREVVTPTPMEKYKKKYNKLPREHKVVKGECLWWIAEYKQIYNDPFMWPLIYKANKNKIQDPDLIYPEQVFDIPRDFTLNELKQNRKSAGAPSNYLPPKSANISVKLRKKLGWSF